MVVFRCWCSPAGFCQEKCTRRRVKQRWTNEATDVSRVSSGTELRVGGKVRGKQLAAPLSTPLPSPAATDAGTGEGTYVPCSSAGRRSCATWLSLDLTCLTACVVHYTLSK